MDSLRICYKTFEIGNLDIHVRMLRDTLQFQDINGAAEKLGICSAAWPIFGVVWPASEILANYMLGYDLDGKQVLEVGCGIALASLVLNHQSARITATDHHPDAERFLDYNTTLNKDLKIPFIRAGWGDLENDLGVFDIIIGSDLLYERNHADLLSGFINRHAKPDCDVIIVDPKRGNHSSFTKKMEDFAFFCEQKTTPVTGNLLPRDNCIILHYSR